MTYHAPSNQLFIKPEQIRQASRMLLKAIREIRTAARLPLKGYSFLSPTPASSAEASIIFAAAELGINLGADRPGNLDVSEI